MPVVTRRPVLPAPALGLDVTLDVALGLRLRVMSTSPESAAAPGLHLRALAAHLPGLDPEAVPAPASAARSGTRTLTLRHEAADAVTLLDQGAQITVFGPWAAVGGDLPHLAWGLLRRSVLGRHYLTLQAAAAGRPLDPQHPGGTTDGTVLIAGASGSGKTRVARAVRALGLALHAGDTCVLRPSAGGLALVAGTRALTVRAGDHGLPPRQMPWPEGLVSPAAAAPPVAPPVATAPDAVEVVDRRLLPAVPGQFAHADVTPVRGVVLVRANGGPLRLELLEGPSALHALWPLALDTARADVLVDGGAALLDGTVPLPIRLALASALSNALRDVPVIRAEGSAADMARVVADLAGVPDPLALPEVDG